MSKMSQLHADMSEQLAELGFKDMREAEANGYHLIYTGNTVKLALDMSKAQDKAHEAWLAEREQVLEDLRELKDIEEMADKFMGKKATYDSVGKLDHAITFIEKGEV
jgi:hypothetical protein